ncbi:hypothetical protein V1506DRAFT_188125 [Lipomyces tetrasporus]
MTAKTELKVGVAGAGLVGSVHTENVIETSGLELVAVCTVVQSEIDWVSKIAPARVPSNYTTYTS